MNNNAVIFGYSGHSYGVIEILKVLKYNVIGYCDNVKKIKNPFNLPYLGTEEEEAVFEKVKNCSAFLGIGSNSIRSEIFNKLKERQINCPVAGHYNASISSSALIGQGTIIMAGVVINSLVQIGNAVICNSSSIIEHECTIGDYVHIAPGAVLAGNVIIGNNSFIGANSVIKQGVSIGSNVTIGAGSVVLNNVNDGMILYGNPAKNRI